MNKNLSKLNNSLRKELSNLISIPKTPPHITLRESFYTSQINNLISELKTNCSEHFPIKTNSKGYQIFDNQYLVLNFKKTENLQKIHNLTIDISQKYIKGFKQYNPIGELSKKQCKLLKKFNNPFSFEYFSPHSTIGKIENNKNTKEINEILDKKPEKEFVFNSISIIDKLRNEIYFSINL